MLLFRIILFIFICLYDSCLGDYNRSPVVSGDNGPGPSSEYVSYLNVYSMCGAENKEIHCELLK